MVHSTVATRSCVAFAALCLIASGCKKEASPPPQAPPPQPAPAASVPSVPATVPATQPDIPTLLNAGGTNWSSHDGGTFDGKSLKSGKDYWIWPAVDVVYSPQETPSGRAVVVKLNYRLRPGGRPVTGGTVYGTLEAAGTGGSRVNLRTPARDFSAADEGGTVAIQFGPWKEPAAGEITVYLNRPGDPALLSNVLRLKVSAP